MLLTAVFVSQKELNQEILLPEKKVLPTKK